MCALIACAHATCGTRGGPGYRSAEGRCVGWADVGKTLRLPAEYPLHAGTGSPNADEAAKHGCKIEELRPAPAGRFRSVAAATNSYWRRSYEVASVCALRCTCGRARSPLSHSSNRAVLVIALPWSAWTQRREAQLEHTSSAGRCSASVRPKWPHGQEIRSIMFGVSSSRKDLRHEIGRRRAPVKERAAESRPRRPR